MADMVGTGAAGFDAYVFVYYNKESWGIMSFFNA